MILAYSVLVLLVLALILRRDLSQLRQIPYRGGWKLATAVLFVFVLQAGFVIFAPGQTIWQMALLITTQLALLFLLLLNHHVPGAKLFALGVVLNTTVMVTNGGWMPVTPENFEFIHPDRTAEVYTRPPSSKNVILPRDETKLWFLSDIIPAAMPWRWWMISPGDVILVLAAGQFIFQIRIGLKKKKPVNYCFI